MSRARRRRPCSRPFRDGKVSQLEHVFIRGSKVRFMIIPDMLKNAPMFKRLDARIKGKGSAIGVGRGRAVVMRARVFNLSVWHAGLSGILRSENNKRTRGDLRKEFLVSCSEDLFALFRCMGQSEIDANCCISDSALHDTLSQLHVTVTKMHGGSDQIHTLIEALLSLCTSENVFIVGRSLRVLHSILRHLLSCEVLSNRKNSVLVEQSPADDVKDEWEIGKKQLLAIFNDIEKGLDEHENPGSILTNIRSSDAQDPFGKVDGFFKKSTLIPFSSWILIFDLVQRVAVKNSKESIRIEALSIMILVLMCSDPIKEREKFGPTPLLESLHQLLQKEVGLAVQKQAIHLLFLLLNYNVSLTPKTRKASTKRVAPPSVKNQLAEACMSLKCF